MKLLAAVFVPVLFLSSCSSLLLKQEAIDRLLQPVSGEHVFIYYDRSYKLSAEGTLLQKTHSLLQLGSDMKSLPQAFYEPDGSFLVLQDFEARILHADGSSASYTKSDLATATTSDAGQISQIKVKYLPITGILRQGDLLEKVAQHHIDLPALGIRFSLAETGRRAYAVSCSFEVPKDNEFIFHVMNDSLQPEIIPGEKSKTYRFYWPAYSRRTWTSPFAAKNTRSPGILANSPLFLRDSKKNTRDAAGWDAFGAWYIQSIQDKLVATPELRTLALELTSGLGDDKQKMDALFNYCQRNVRYEQVYLDHGEFIPNDVGSIFKRKYGDCKDYSALIYTLAREAGIAVNFALCFRGRGYRSYPEIAVSQFNHIIIYYYYNGKEYWYDGTNRTGIPGLTTIDLINQPALVMGKDRSRFITIQEREDNLLDISASMKLAGKTLSGNLDLTFRNQYAIDFFYAKMYFNRAKMRDYLVKWLKNKLNDNIICRGMQWTGNASEFTVSLVCELPNAAIQFDAEYYLSLARMFPDLLPQRELPDSDKELFYFPYYNRVNFSIDLQDLSSDSIPGKWKYRYNLPPGPFTDVSRGHFREHFQKVIIRFKEKIKFKERETS